MPQFARSVLFGLLVGIIAVAPVAAAAAPSGASTLTAGLNAPGDPLTLSTAKVVIIVGATHSSTSHYREIGDEAYAVAIQYSSNVVKVYSPNATWAAAKAALQGASVVLYLGHGNGWPSPYPYDPTFTARNGLGLNATAGNGDNNTKYYGEPYLANEVDLAPNAIVLLNHLCYASGNSEPGTTDPTLSVAMQRVDNYGAGFIKAGASAVMAEGHGSVNGVIRDLFTTNQSILDLWRNQYDYNGNEFSFPSTRSPGYSAFMDPDSPTGGYYRSLVGNPSLRTEDVTGVAIGPAPDPLPSPDASAVTRLAGIDRYSTAAAIAATYTAGAPVVYIATGLNFPDALTGAAAAGPTGGPLLLVTKDTIPVATAAELVRLQPARIVILGATGVISDAVESALGAYTAGGVVRLAGDNRYGTAAAISAASYTPGVPVVYLATGQDFPDALAGAASAGSTGAPMLLVTKDGLPASTAAELARLRPARIVLLGSPTTVSDAVLLALGGFTAGGVTRVAGLDLYSTAAAISAATFAPGVPVAYIATGLNFPDALAGAAVAGFTDGPLLLTMKDGLPAAAAAELARLQPARIVILGGSGVVTDAVQTQLQSFVRG
ncbi:MAG: hypothetical protein HW391_1999 [Chloroflexi bacterium]|nr:hypothetical protein [Chloroflexota bacterium]